jgi:initiation factor 1A
MPNLHGGKSYKKGKKVSHEKDEGGKKFYSRDDDQDYARVIRMLGNRRVVCFCNDGYERVCKIRGALCKGPKRQKIEVGDIVFISFRDFDEDSDEESSAQHTLTGGSDATGNVQVFASGRKEIADIIDKVHRDHWRHIKKEAGIHKDLFFTAAGNDVGDIFDYAAEKEEESEELDDGDIDAI